MDRFFIYIYILDELLKERNKRFKYLERSVRFGLVGLGVIVYV